MNATIQPTLFTDLRKNSTEDLCCAALVQLTNHEIMLGDIPPIQSLTVIREIIEELRYRDNLMRCMDRGNPQ